ncbi:MAG: L,D-transpeptidase family protein [Rhodobacteraceae bacterium]|nr:L,D-transpeptidase family protein [Paracoccaceae bacterium]
MKTADLITVSQWGAHCLNRFLPCSVGLKGIKTKKQEGDKATPSGNFTLGPIFYRPDRINPRGVNMPKVQIRRDSLWSDDGNDEFYNQLVHSFSPWPFSHEKLFRPDPLYDMVIPVHYNSIAPIAGKGSAIFLHIWRGPRIPTEGCIAFCREDLLWLCRVITPSTQIHINCGHWWGKGWNWAAKRGLKTVP